MTAYYNEIDPYAAEWLRNLIRAGHIAQGDVDERSIADVRGADLVGYTQCHFFAGIGVWSRSLRLADGPTTDLFGQEVAPASPSPSPEREKATRTSATFGRTGTGSSASADLQRSLESRLLPRLEQAGSTMFSYRLSRLGTPSGRSISRLAASARRTSEAGFTSWPTPAVHDTHGMDLKRYSDAAMQREIDRPNRGQSLAIDARMAAWATPSSRDWKDSPGMATTGTDPDGTERSRLDQLPRQAQLTDSGPTPSGSPAATAKRGQLNPALSRWLQGLPPEWCALAPTAKPKR